VPRAGLTAAVLLLAFAVPAAAGTHLTDLQVRSIAARDTRVTAAMTAHPLAYWQPVYVTRRGWWIVRLAEPGKAVLAVVTVRDADAKVVGARIRPAAKTPVNLTQEKAAKIAAASPKAADWVARYKRAGRAIQTQTAYDVGGTWTTHWWSNGEEIARVVIDDRKGTITTVWTGPQVAWSMARGGKGAFGKRINDPIIFLPLLAVFCIGLLDWRRLRSLRTLDVIALASFGVSLHYFNRGLVFWSVPLQYPPLVYLFCRMVAIGCGRGRRSAYMTRWPLWLVAGIAVFAMGFRGGLNYWSSNVADIGFAGVVGASRLLDGQSPYGNMPKPTGKPCGIKYSDGTYSAYVQKSGRCEAPVEQGDTYGPVMYDAYVPMTAALGWTGKWDDLPAAHGTAALFDALAAMGVAFCGWRLGGRRLAAAALFFWATFPFTVFAMSSNSNDAVVAAFMAWSLALFTYPFVRGLMLGLAAWAKFAPLVVIPLFIRAGRRPRSEPAEWAYDDRGPALVRRPGRAGRAFDAVRLGPGGFRTILGLLAATVIAFGVLVVLDGPHGLRVFWDRTFGWQLDRPSPFSIWDWGGYPGFPDLGIVQKVLKGLLVVFALGLYLRPKRLDLARVAAFSAALLIGFQIVLTHWFYLYIPWFVPSLVIALLAPRREYAASTVEDAVEVAPERRSPAPVPADALA
jgi:hypothetical protein